MVTTSTKMIDKQIATAEKKIEKLLANIERYKGLAEKKYAKLLKIYPTLSKYTLNELSDFTSIFGRDNWDLAYGYFDNLRSIVNNKKDLAYEQKHLETLQNKKANKENATMEYMDSTQELVNKFEELLKEYKQSYFEDCESKFTKLYNKMKSSYASAKAIVKRANDELPYFFGTYHSYNYSHIMKNYLAVREGMLGYYSLNTYNKKFIPFTEEECNLISEWKVAYNIVHSDCQRFDTLESYIEYKMNEVAEDWDVKMRAFANKCLKFGLNMDSVEFIITNTSVTNCQFMLKDDESRIIYGRCIWAAEYSDIVTPHIRFIVTEKRYK